MKKITNYIKMLAIFCILAGAKTGMAQTCTPTFNWASAAAGGITFTASAPGYSSVAPGTFFWVYGSAGATSTSSVPVTSYSYPANGIYTVTLVYINANLTCSASITQTVSVSNYSPAPCTANANFYYGQVNNTVMFGNTSSNANSYSWNYGDGSPLSTAVNGSHVYAGPGPYNVTLYAYNTAIPGCVDSVTYAVNLCTLTASFTYTSGANGVVNFAATGTGVSNYSWYFGSGPNVTGTTPTHSYTTNGNYVVYLTASSGNCSVTAQATVNVSNIPVPCSLNASFFTTNSANGVVNFTNTTSGSTGSTTYTWSFGDGTTSTVSPFTSHTYSANGTYTVILSANNNGSVTCTDTQVTVIYVNSYCNVNAGFTYSMGLNGLVYFTNTSSGTSAPFGYSWNFGDGNFSSGTNPSHTFATGTYTVLLTATNYSTSPLCWDTISQVISITNTCVADASFSLSPTGTPQVWNAFPINPPANLSSAVWNWGDGTSSSTLYTSHTYSAAGMYTISLSVTDSCGATDFYFGNYFIYRSSQDMSMVQVNVVAPATITGIKAVKNAELISSIYPNPSNGSFNLDLKGLGSNVNISVYNLVGTLVYQSDAASNNGTLVKDIQLDNAANGVYFVKVNTDSKSFTKKVIINKQ